MSKILNRIASWFEQPLVDDYVTQTRLADLRIRIRLARHKLEDANQDEDMQFWLYDAEEALGNLRWFGDVIDPLDRPLMERP